MYFCSYHTVKMTAIAHKTIALTVACHAEESSSIRARGGGETGGSGGGGIVGGGTNVVSASLAADVASAATAASTAKLSKLEASIAGIAPNSSSIGSVSVDVAATPSAARLSSAAESFVSSTVKGLAITVTSYAVPATTRRLLLVLTDASNAPRLASSCIFKNAWAHATSPDSAVRAIATFFTFRPAIAASANSFAFALVLSSPMSARSAFRETSASSVLD